MGPLPGPRAAGRGERNGMGGPAAEGHSPVREPTSRSGPAPESGRARETRSEPGGTTLQS